MGTEEIVSTIFLCSLRRSVSAPAMLTHASNNYPGLRLLMQTQKVTEEKEGETNRRIGKSFIEPCTAKLPENS